MLFGDPYENRTRDAAVKGRSLNRLTTGPLLYGNGQCPNFMNGSGTWIRTGDNSGMNRVL